MATALVRGVVQQIGKTLRLTGQQLDKVGVGLEGRYAYTEHLNPSTRVVAHSGKQPSIAPDAFVAANASVIGDVQLGPGSSVWYGATIRGDVNYATIGANTNIQDQAVVHVAKFGTDNPTIIGDNVTIGPNAIIHACTIQDNCVIGTGAQVLDGAVVSKESMLAAGSLLPMGKTIPSRQLWSGIPAQYVRDLTAQELEFMRQGADLYSELAVAHVKEDVKTFEQLEAEEERRELVEVLGEEALQERPGRRDDEGLFFKY